MWHYLHERSLEQHFGDLFTVIWRSPKLEESGDRSNHSAKGIRYGSKPRKTSSNSALSPDRAEELSQQKIEARLRLLEMPPEEAQKIVEQTLYPELWDCRLEDRRWEESLPSHYGEEVIP